MTDHQKLEILRLRSERVSLREIANSLNVNFQHMVRFLAAVDHSDARASSIAGTSKVLADTPGELDFSAFENREEQARAAELWFARMGDARWNVRRRPDQG